MSMAYRMTRVSVETWLITLLRNVWHRLRACRDHFPDLNVTDMVFAGDCSFPTH